MSRNRIVPKRPTGTGERAKFLQWVHDELTELNPIFVQGQQMGSVSQGFYEIQRPPQKLILPPIVRVSDNLLQYLFDHYEMANTVYDGAMVLTGVRSGLEISGGRVPYLRVFHYPHFASSDVINLKIDRVAGVWTLTVAKNSDPPFYTGTNPAGPLGDYNGTGNPTDTDPVTVTENIPWQVSVDDTFIAWVHGTTIPANSIPQVLGFTDPAPFTGDQEYAEYNFGAGSIFAAIILEHIEHVLDGPRNWYLRAAGSAVEYTRDDGDGPSPLGIYSLTTNLWGGTTPPATLTITDYSDNAPFEP